MDFAGAMLGRQRDALVRLLLGGGFGQEGGDETSFLGDWGVENPLPHPSRDGDGTAFRFAWGRSGGTVEAVPPVWGSFGGFAPPGREGIVLDGTGGKPYAASGRPDGTAARIHRAGRPVRGEWNAFGSPELMDGDGAQAAPAPSGGVEPDFQYPPVEMPADSFLGGWESSWEFSSMAADARRGADGVEDAQEEGRAVSTPLSARERGRTAEESGAGSPSGAGDRSGTAEPPDGGLLARVRPASRGEDGSLGDSGFLAEGFFLEDGTSFGTGRSGGRTALPVLALGSNAAFHFDAQNLSRTFQRDARRYDGGFVLF